VLASFLPCLFALQGILHPGWSDSQHNLWQHTWHVAHKLSSNLNPQMLSPAMNPSRQAMQQQQQQQGLAGLPTMQQVVLPQQLQPQLMVQQQQQQQPGLQQQPLMHPVVDAAAPVAVDGQLQQQQQQLPAVQQQAAH